MDNAIKKELERQKLQTVKKYAQLNKIAQKGQIVFTGSSLCEHFPVNEIAMSMGLPCKIYNRGISGDDTSGMLLRMEESIFELEPSKLFINIGTNDISAPDYTPERLIERYSDILKRIKERLPETSIYVMGYYPVNRTSAFITGHMGARTNDEINRVNLLLEQMAKELDCEYIELFDCLTDGKGNLCSDYTTDGMHLYPEAYFIIFNELKPYLL